MIHLLRRTSGDHQFVIDLIGPCLRLISMAERLPIIFSEVLGQEPRR